ncbi:MAG: DUF1904 domain-containing protein [Synergistaceae bacterium]|nr:DUF1904 domain-containing protein [Synergistaceae bacterium]
MPHITVRGVSKEKLKEYAEDVKNIVVSASEVKREYVKIFYSPVERVDAAAETAVDVYWMPRTQELRDRVAAQLTEYFQKKGSPFVQVTFTEFQGNLFYENGVHY